MPTCTAPMWIWHALPALYSIMLLATICRCQAKNFSDLQSGAFGDDVPSVTNLEDVSCDASLLHSGSSRPEGCEEETSAHTLLQTGHTLLDTRDSYTSGHAANTMSGPHAFRMAPNQLQGGRDVDPVVIKKPAMELDVNELLASESGEHLKTDHDAAAYAQGLLESRINLEKTLMQSTIALSKMVSQSKMMSLAAHRDIATSTGSNLSTEAPTEAPAVASAAELSGVGQNGEGDLVAFLYTLASAFIMLMICSCLVSLFRRWYPLVFQKNSKPYRVDGTDPLPDTFFGWVHPMYALKVDRIEQYANLDHAMFIEFTHFSMKLCLFIGLPAMCILAPLHCFCGGNRAGPDHLSWLGMANVVDGNWLYWLHAPTVWYNVIVTQVLVCTTMNNHCLKRRWNYLRSIPPKQACTVLIEGVPPGNQTDSGVKALFDKDIYGRPVVGSAFIVKDTAELLRLLKDEESTDRALKENKYEGCLWKLKSCLGLVLPTKAALEEQLEKDKREIMAKRVEARMDDNLNLSRAFVTFKTRRDAAITQKLFQECDDEEMVAYPAPIPSDIIWSDLTVDEGAQYVRDTLGDLLIVGMVFVILPLVLGIATITSISVLGQYFPFVNGWAAANPDLASLWEGLVGALALSQVMALIPTILGLIFGFCFCLRSHINYQILLQFYYFWFLILFVLLVTCVGSSVLETLEDIVKDPLSIFNLVADTMPYASHFYLSYFPVQTASLAQEFTRYLTVIKYRSFSHFYDEDVAIGMAEPEDQDFYGMGSRSARMTLLTVIVLTFSTISPLITMLGLMQFFFARGIYGFLFTYAETLKADSGGRFFITQLEHTQFGLYIYVILMAAVLAQRATSRIPGLIAGAAILAVWVPNRRFHKTFKARFEALPFQELDQTSKEGQSRSIPGSYRQPELLTPELLAPEAPPSQDSKAREENMFGFGSMASSLNCAPPAAGPKDSLKY